MGIVPIIGSMAAPYFAKELFGGYLSPTICSIIGSSLFQCCTSKSKSYASIVANVIGSVGTGEVVKYFFGKYLHPFVCSIMGSVLFQYGVSKLRGRVAPLDPLLDELIQALNQQKDNVQECVRVLKSLKGKPADVVQQNEVFRTLMSSMQQSLSDRPISHPLTEKRIEDLIKEAAIEVANHLKMGENRATEAEARRYLGDYKVEYHDAIIAALREIEGFTLL